MEILAKTARATEGGNKFFLKFSPGIGISRVFILDYHLHLLVDKNDLFHGLREEVI
jgi:hypothetical protein